MYRSHRHPGEQSSGSEQHGQPNNSKLIPSILRTRAHRRSEASHRKPSPTIGRRDIFPGAQQYIPTPELLPLVIYYDSPPQIPSLCEGTLLALPEVLDASRELIKPSVQYMVVCPQWFETGRWRLVDGINQNFQAYWATEHGYATLAGEIGAGLESSSTDIVHELLHWWSFLGTFANAVIDDETIKLEDSSFDQDAQTRTPWLATQLKIRKPQLCVSQHLLA